MRLYSYSYKCSKCGTTVRVPSVKRLDDPRAKFGWVECPKCGRGSMPEEYKEEVVDD